MSILGRLLRPVPLFLVAALLRLGLLVYGSWQDAHSAVKYTDVDYLVFTDAARFVVGGGGDASRRALGPYARDTYRYTPLLAWLLAPTAVPGLFAFGKLVFAAADVVAGALILALLRRRGRGHDDAAAFAALWLWNPMVAAISTRGSSEGLLGLLTMALLWAVETRRVELAGFVLGLAVHFKIYPFIYAPAIVWWLDDERMPKPSFSTTSSSSSPSSSNRPTGPQSPAAALVRFCSPARIRLAAVSLATFMGLNLLMYSMFVFPLLVSHLIPQPDQDAALSRQIWDPIPRPYVPAPRHPYRPPAQLLALQCPPLPHLGHALAHLLAAHRIPRLRSPAAPLVRPHPPGRCQKGPGHLHDGPDPCLCHLQ